MQDRYAGDIGDFAKLLLLKEFSDSFEARLGKERGTGVGIVWYRCDPTEVDGKRAHKDGGSVEYLLEDGGEGKIKPDVLALLKKSDPALYSILSNLVHRKKTRDVRSMESLLVEGRYFPPTHRFFNDMLSLSGTPTEKTRQRQDWYRNALKAVGDCGLVFLDPDDGLPPPGKAHLQKKGPKYAFYHEIAGFLVRGQSTIIIQYPARENEEDRYRRYVEPLKLYCSTGSEPTALRFRVIKFPRFIVLSQPGHREAVEEAANTLVTKHGQLFERLEGSGDDW